MKTYKKPVSILVEVDIEDLMDISQGQILNNGTQTSEKDLSGSGQNTSDLDEGIGADAKGFGSWE